MGRRMVLQYYLGKTMWEYKGIIVMETSRLTTFLGASVVGLIVIIGWVGKYGFNNRTAAGI